MPLLTAPCDLCGSTSFTPLYPGTITSPDDDPAAYYSSSRTKAGYLPIVRCANCGLVMTNPRDDLPTIKRVYAQLADAVYDAEDDNRRRTARAYLSLIRQYCPTPTTLLDVGCATGVFACEAQAAGWRVTGLEASTWAIQRAQTRCTGVSWLNVLMEEAAMSPESVDVITLWDVLEHVHSPTQTLSLLNRWLKPGGWLFLNLPNSASRVAKLLGPRWVLLLREHLWYFSPATLRLALEKTGFDLRHTRSNWVRFSLANIAGRLGQYPGVVGALGRRWAGHNWLKPLALTFPMGEMNGAAQKR